MTKYSHEAGELVDYTPDSLANIAAPPVFRLRPATERDKRLIKKLIFKEGLVRHSDQALRDEMLRGLKALWSENIFTENEGRLRAYWDALDQYEAHVAGIPFADRPAFEHADSTAMDELSERVRRSWGPLRDMGADNAEFDEVWPKLIASVVIAGWSGLNASYSREDGMVTMEAMEAAREALTSLEVQAAADKVEGIAFPGSAFLELITRAIGMFQLSKGEEKNSVSPSKSDPPPSTLKKAGRDKASGSSTALNTTETLEV